MLDRATKWLIAVAISLAIAPGFAETKPPAKVFGWVEEGQIQPEKLSLKIKLDTGALTSSMDAKNLEWFEKGSEEWVRFNVEVKDSMTGKMTNSSFERKVVRNVKIRGAGGAERRPVVMMKLCIGSRMYDEEFSLKDRGKMNYPVLIGRSTLARIGAVDASRTFTVEPRCDTP
ncbi:ATP-dependent zinc protease [Pseudomonas sp. Marseille-Q5115]|uniref:retropepsin-like aspartic peptidase RloA3 n=1 Tax=Pseudomonas sp. Marseille-Q5115 TaxID=2866593 RepID=UPI001CE48A58|nr:ATP-dependent zinc protease [Pseudomonas sp. Marseille-Q5115]